MKSKLNLMKVVFISIGAILTMASCKGKAQPNVNKTDAPKNAISTQVYAGVEHLTDAGFKAKVFNYVDNREWKYEGDIPAIVDFYADWCAPCRRVAPIIEELSKEYAGKIKVYKVNTDEEQMLTQSLGITNLPTILFVPKNGKPQATMGMMPKEDFEKLIKDVLLVD